MLKHFCKEKQKVKKPNSRPAPAYQEYASDMLANREFRLMGLAERGLFWTMRMECWVNKSVPSDWNELAKMFNLNEHAVSTLLSDDLLSFFVCRESSLFCKELEDYRENMQAVRAAQSEGGRNGGRATQSRSRQAKADLQAEVKPLSREEQSGDELNRRGLIKEELTGEMDEWLADYDNGKSKLVKSYEEKSKGH
jgi:hypothetical protein